MTLTLPFTLALYHYPVRTMQAPTLPPMPFEACEQSCDRILAPRLLSSVAIFLVFETGMADKDGGSMTSKQMQKAHWPVDAERKLIEIWAEVLHRFSCSMTKKKAKAQKAADLLNDYARQELPGISYSVDEVLTKVDNISAKARMFYAQYQQTMTTWVLT